MDRLLLTPLEAAKLLGIGRSKLYELISAEIIPSVQIGSCRRISADELSAYVARLHSNGKDAVA